uniref:Uncharacterized protein n=1 Tax=Lepeophtheirus salmonis TaxID=72036 RepID=A0A0K2U9P0_LEPSM
MICNFSHSQKEVVSSFIQHFRNKFNTSH